jgi:mannose-1-phosphate guanylyltransferase
MKQQSKKRLKSIKDISLLGCTSKPETGYGYIERKGDDVISFREKPNQVSARIL